MAGLSRIIRGNDGAWSMRLGGDPGGDFVEHDWRAGVGVLRESVWRRVLGRSTLSNRETCSRMRSSDARLNDVAWRVMCSNWPGASIFLANGSAGGGRLESGLGQGGKSRAAGFSRQS